ncbi:MAG: hypothetical protein QOF53_2126 [Nocardioidaceae bacterium]|jgi:hypothetical protein|nr:hypothetical protein [Nocardioidaceae bacterium]
MPDRRSHVNEPEGGDPLREAIEDVVVRATSAAAEGRPAVAALNPEAGSHAVTSDPRELRAAIDAGERTRRRFVYYERRYGERGQRFTHSDSAWIVTLAGRPPGVAEGQLRWLGALLAARGMPRWLLEEHLEVLHDELVAAVPEKRSDYDELLRIATLFRDERRSHLDETTSSEVAQAFHRRVGSTAAAELPEAGALLVAAVAEERVGLAGVVDSLMQWLADPARFPAGWVAAATEAIATARQLART